VVVANDHDFSLIHHGVIVDVQASRCERTPLLEMGMRPCSVRDRRTDNRGSVPLRPVIVPLSDGKQSTRGTGSAMGVVLVRQPVVAQRRLSPPTNRRDLSLAHPAIHALGEQWLVLRRCYRHGTHRHCRSSLTGMPTKPTTPPALDQAAAAQLSTSTGLRSLGAAMVVILLGELMLGMANALWLQLPDSGSGWAAGSSSGLLGIHMLLGLALVVLAVWIAVAAVRGRDRTWLTASIVGVVGILLAFGSGLAFMGQTSNNVASFCMALGCALAIAGYTHGLYRIPTNSR
jgi:hypothetical protein